MSRAMLRSHASWLVCLSLIGVSAGCAARHVPVATATVSDPAAADFIDLQAGWRLRVVTPILKSGKYVLDSNAQSVSGNTISLSNSDFLGYELAYYNVSARRRGVRISFTSAEIRRDGNSTSQASPTMPLFGMPSDIRYVRLLFLLRVSAADHDMAVVAADSMDRLDELTRQIQSNPSDACKRGSRMSCSWVPSGISVNPELPRVVNGTTEWVPATGGPRPPT